MKIFSHPVVNRKIVCLLGGVGFGFLCAYFASTGMVDQEFWWTPAMWGIVINRTLIGFFILLAGVFNYNALLKIKYWAWLRGAVIGTIVSFDLAVWNLMIPDMAASEVWFIFWMTILFGAIYGLIIDQVATWLFGDGKKLAEGWSK
jgi:hypothetical protein